MSFYPSLYEASKKRTDSSIPGEEVNKAIKDIRSLPGLQNLSGDEVDALKFLPGENWGKATSANILSAKELYDELSGELVGIQTSKGIDPFAPIPEDIKLTGVVKGPKRRLFDLFQDQGKSFADLVKTLKTWNKSIQRFFDELESETFVASKEDVKTTLEKYFESKTSDGGKKFNEFLHSLPGGESQKYVNWLLELMASVVQTEGKQPVTGRITKDMKLSAEQASEWYKNMPKYLKTYSKVKEIEPIYHKEILKRDSFLNTLFLIKPEGVGRGEIMFAYLFNDCKISGGGLPYDVYLGGGKKGESNNKVELGAEDTKFELKDYVIDNKTLGVKKIEDDSIRLGTGGKVTRFGFWHQFSETVRICTVLFDKFGEKRIKDMVGDYMTKVWKNVIDLNGGNLKAFAAGVESGELSTEKIIVVKGFYALANSLKENQEDGGYKTIKMGGKTYLVGSPKDVKKGDKIEILGEATIEEIIDELSKIKYVDHPDQLERDLNGVAKEYFDKEGLDAFVVFRPAGINIAKRDDFLYATVSQAGVKFVEKEAVLIAKGDKLHNAAKALMDKKIAIEVKKIMDMPGNQRSEKEVRSEVEKNYQIDDFYLMVLKTGKASDRLTAKGVANESFYPQLF